MYLSTYHLETGLFNENHFQGSTKSKAFLNKNGRLAIISGDTDGQSDLFLVSVLRNSVRRITFDIFDDTIQLLYPVPLQSFLVLIVPQML